MAIWEYRHRGRFELSAEGQSAFASNHEWGAHHASGESQRLLCAYCGTRLTLLAKESTPPAATLANPGTKLLSACSACGWWVVAQREGFSAGYEGSVALRRTSGILRSLDLSDVALPMEE